MFFEVLGQIFQSSNNYLDLYFDIPCTVLRYRSSFALSLSRAQPTSFDFLFVAFWGSISGKGWIIILTAASQVRINREKEKKKTKVGSVPFDQLAETIFQENSERNLRVPILIKLDKLQKLSLWNVESTT